MYTEIQAYFPLNVSHRAVPQTVKRISDTAVLPKHLLQGKPSAACLPCREMSVE
jgi:hypothetical protein